MFNPKNILNKWLRWLVFSVAGLVITVAALYAYYRWGTVRVTPVGPSVSIVSAQAFGSPLGANMVIVETDHGSLVVDTQLPILGTPISLALERHGLARPSAVINTHWHPDHNGGNTSIAAGATIYARAKTLEYMRSAQQAHGLVAPNSEHEFPPRLESDWPTDLIDTPTAIEIDGIVVRMYAPTAGHTNGDLAAYFPALGVIAVGDLVWPNALPFADVEHGGDVRGMIVFLRQLLDELPPETLLVSGHSPPITLDKLIDYADTLEDAVEEMSKQPQLGPERGPNEPAAALNTLATALVPAWRWQEMLSARLVE